MRRCDGACCPLQEEAEEQRSLASKAKGQGDLEEANKHEEKARALEEEMEQQIERPDGAGASAPGPWASRPSPSALHSA